MKKQKREMKSPIGWFGGKNMLVTSFLPYVPEHNTFVEVFGGSGSFVFGKKPAKMDVYNDIDSGLNNFWSMIKSPMWKRVQLIASMIPFSREEYYHNRATWKDIKDPAEKAAVWFSIARQSFSGSFGGGWKFAKNHIRRGMAGGVSGYFNGIEDMPKINKRLQNVVIENADFRDLISKYDSAETFFYLDPPYVHSTRKGGEYDHELEDFDHVALVDMLLKLKGKAMLSGYENKLYERLEEAGWRKVKFDVVCTAFCAKDDEGEANKMRTDSRNKRVEVLWMNY